MPKRPRSTKNGKPPTRRREEEVFAAAVKLFNERGYAATSVENVADALGILKGSLYYYIGSKEDLLFRIVSEVHVDARRIVEEALARKDLDARQRLALYVRNQAEYNAKNVARVSVYYRDLDQLSPARLKEIRARRGEHFRALVALIEEAQADGLIATNVDPALAAHGVLSTIIWPFTWFRASGKVKPAELADFCVGYVLGGLGSFDPIAIDELAEASST